MRPRIEKVLDSSSYASSNPVVGLAEIVAAVERVLADRDVAVVLAEPLLTNSGTVVLERAGVEGRAPTTTRIGLPTGKDADGC